MNFMESCRSESTAKKDISSTGLQPTWSAQESQLKVILAITTAMQGSCTYPVSLKFPTPYVNMCKN